MPTHVIEVNGVTHRVQAPADATDDQLLAAVEAQGGAKGAPTPTGGAKTAPEGQESQRAGGYGPFMAGVADAGVRGYLGVKQLLGGLDDEEKAILREQQAEEEADPEKLKRLGGNAGANIVLGLVPGAVATRGVASVTKALPKALQFLAPTAAAGVASGGQSAVLTPGETDDGAGFVEQLLAKSKAAAKDAALGAGLGAGGQVLKKTLVDGLVKPSVEALRLLKQGINPTLQQGSESPVARWIGGLTSGAVDVSKRQNQEVLDALLKRIQPSLDLSDMNVPEKVRLLRENFLGDNAGKLGEFDQLFDGKKFMLTQPKRSQIWAEARGPKGTQPDATAMALHAMSGTGSAMTSKNTVPMGPTKMREYRDLLQDAIDRISKDGTIDKQARENLIRAKQKFDELVRDPALSPAERQTLKGINERYSDFLRYQSAAGKPGFHSKPKAADVLREYADADPTGGVNFAQAKNRTQEELLEPAARVMGLTPRQDEARSLISAAKRAVAPYAKAAVLGGAGAATVGAGTAGAVLAPLYAVSLLGQTGKGAKALFGETDAQKKLAEIIRKAAPYFAGSGQTLTGED